MSAESSKPVRLDILRIGHCQHAECMAMRGMGRTAIDFPALVGLIEHPTRGLILYDTGYADHFFQVTRTFPECLYRMVTPVQLPPEERLLNQLEERGIRPADIETVIISHFHADHIAGLRDFAEARFIATRAELARSTARGRLGRLQKAFLRDLLPPDFESRLIPAESTTKLPLGPQWHPFEDAYDLLGDQSILGIDLPGHTASQLGLTFSTSDKGTVFLIADACWKIEGLQQDLKPSRLAYLLFDNSQAYNKTFSDLRTLEMSENGPTIIPSHCATTWKQLGNTRTIDRSRGNEPHPSATS